MTSKRLLLAATAVCALLLGLSACGSSSKKTATTAQSSTNSAAVTKVPGQAFKLGFICSCSGASSAATADTSAVIKAWASATNASGGINGHPVQVTVYDDGGVAAPSLQFAKKLVAAGVMAIVGHGTLQDGSWATYVASKGIPVVGGLAPEPTFFTNPDFFPAGAVLPAVLLGQVREAAAAGKNHFGVAFCSEVPVCKELVGLAKVAAAAVGGVNVSGRAISFTQPTYAAQCLGFKSDGVDTLFTAAAAPTVIHVADSCAQQGYKPTQNNEGGTADQTWLKDSSMNGAVIISSNAPWFDTSVPGVKAFSDAMRQYAPSVLSSAQFGADDLMPWAGGTLFKAAATAGHLTPSSTPADLKAALYSLKNETLDGLSGPLNYVKDKPSFPACYFVVGVANGAFTTPKGTQAICPSSAQVTAFAKALAG